MGSDKAGVQIAGRPMIEWPALALQPIVGSTMVVGRESTPVAAAIPDHGTRHRGPLAGLVTAVEAAPDAVLVVVAVDQPWVRTRTLQALVERADRLPVVPVDEHGVRQTTCAVYPAGALSDVADELEVGGSIQSLLDRVAFDPVVAAEWEMWGEDGRSWFSVDRPEDVTAGLERFGAPGQPPM